MLYKINNPRFNKLSLKYESEVVEKLNNIYSRKNFNNVQIEIVSEQSFKEYFKKNNKTDFNSSTAFKQNIFCKDNQENTWFAKLDFYLASEESSSKSKTSVARINMSELEAITLLLPQLSKKNQRINKKVEVYVNDLINENKISEFLELFAYKLCLK